MLTNRLQILRGKSSLLLLFSYVSLSDQCCFVGTISILISRMCVCVTEKAAVYKRSNNTASPSETKRCRATNISKHCTLYKEQQRTKNQYGRLQNKYSLHSQPQPFGRPRLNASQGSTKGGTPNRHVNQKTGNWMNKLPTMFWFCGHMVEWRQIV